MKFKLITLCVLASLAACGGGGDSTSSQQAQLEQTQPQSPESLPLNCTDGTMLSSATYGAENNTWGKGDLTGWSQCVGIGVGPAGSVSARFTWNWLNSGDNVKAYPEVIYGYKPSTKSTTSSLPRQINTLKELSVQYYVTSTHTGTGNLAFDIWLTNTAAPSTFTVPPITHEIMVWLESYGGMVVGGDYRGMATINGVSYDVYVGENFGLGWRYIAFKRTTTQRGAATLNLRAILDYAQANNLISGQEYVASVEFGNEVVSGSGDTKINQFAVTVR